MVQATAEAFETAKTAYTLYGWLLQEVAKESGWEKAVELHTRIGDLWAGVLSGMLRDQCGEQKLDAASVASVTDGGYKHLGVDFEVGVRDDGVTGRVARCPMYEGFSAAGIDHATIDRLCSSVSNRVYDRIHASFPELTVGLKFREKADDVCVEEYALAK